MASPQTTREALIAELLADIAPLLDRADVLLASFPEAANAAATKVKAAGEQASRDFADNAQKVSRESVARHAELLEAIQKASADAKAAALIVDKGYKRFALLALLTGLCGGVVGGLLVGLAAATSVFG